MKKVTLYIDDKFDAISVTAIGENITTFAVKIEDKNVFKIRNDGEVRNLKEDPEESAWEK